MYSYSQFFKHVIKIETKEVVEVCDLLELSKCLEDVRMLLVDITAPSHLISTKLAIVENLYNLCVNIQPAGVAYLTDDGHYLKRSEAFSADTLGGHVSTLEEAQDVLQQLDRTDLYDNVDEVVRDLLDLVDKLNDAEETSS